MDLFSDPAVLFLLPQLHDSVITVDLDLVRKYDIPAPRYTSYPTAAASSGIFAGPGPLLAHLDETNRDASRPLSLYFHLPLLAARSAWFCGWKTTVITVNH